MRALHLLQLAAIAMLAGNVAIGDESPDESKAILKIKLLSGTVTRDETRPSKGHDRILTCAGDMWRALA